MESGLLECDEFERKDENFWKELREWDVVVLSETWMDEKRWEKVKGKLEGGFEWEVQLARRKSKKGRAMGGILMGIRRELLERETKIEMEEEGIMMGRMKQGREIW